MTIWYTAKFDRRRLHRVLREVGKRRPEAIEMWNYLCSFLGTGDEVTRLLLADLFEEEGQPVIAKMIREWITTRGKPRRKCEQHRTDRSPRHAR